MGGLCGGFVSPSQQQGRGGWFSLGEEAGLTQERWNWGGERSNAHSSWDSAGKGKLWSPPIQTEISTSKAGAGKYLNLIL